MKKILLGGLAFLVAAAGLWAADGGSTAAVHARGQEFLAAWAKNDSQALAAIWAEDGDLINPFGRVAKGRTEVEKLFHDEQTTMMKGTTFTVLSETIREIAPDTAIADWESEITGMQSPHGALPPLKNHVTIVFVKKGGQWWVAAARPEAYLPPPGAPKPM
jgi:uncharacterized protein (TIGR02246 family)